MSGSTPAASTNNALIFNSLQEKSAEQAKNIVDNKPFRINKMRFSIRHCDEPPSEKMANIFVRCESIRITGLEGRKCNPN
jgi:hypothetical protein